MRVPCVLRKAVLTLVLSLGVVAAQGLTANEFGIGQSMKHNSDVLQHYTYKRRTEITLKGESRGERIDLIRTVDGRKETIPLETTGRTGEARSRRGLRGKIVERKIEK